MPQWAHVYEDNLVTTSSPTSVSDIVKLIEAMAKPSKPFRLERDSSAFNSATHHWPGTYIEHNSIDSSQSSVSRSLGSITNIDKEQRWSHLDALSISSSVPLLHEFSQGGSLTQDAHSVIPTGDLPFYSQHNSSATSSDAVFLLRHEPLGLLSGQFNNGFEHLLCRNTSRDSAMSSSTGSMQSTVTIFDDRAQDHLLRCTVLGSDPSPVVTDSEEYYPSQPISPIRILSLKDSATQWLLKHYQDHEKSFYHFQGAIFELVDSTDLEVKQPFLCQRLSQKHYNAPAFMQIIKKPTENRASVVSSQAQREGSVMLLPEDLAFVQNYDIRAAPDVQQESNQVVRGTQPLPLPQDPVHEVRQPVICFLPDAAAKTLEAHVNNSATQTPQKQSLPDSSDSLSLSDTETCSILQAEATAVSYIDRRFLLANRHQAVPRVDHEDTEWRTTIDTRSTPWSLLSEAASNWDPLRMSDEKWRAESRPVTNSAIQELPAGCCLSSPAIKPDRLHLRNVDGGNDDLPILHYQHSSITMPCPSFPLKGNQVGRKFRRGERLPDGTIFEEAYCPTHKRWEFSNIANLSADQRRKMARDDPTYFTTQIKIGRLLLGVGFATYFVGGFYLIHSLASGGSVAQDAMLQMSFVKGGPPVNDVDVRTAQAAQAMERLMLPVFIVVLGVCIGVCIWAITR